MQANEPNFESTNLHDTKAATFENSTSLGYNATRRDRLVSKRNMFQTSLTPNFNTCHSHFCWRWLENVTSDSMIGHTHLPAPNGSQFRKTSSRMLMNSKKSLELAIFNAGVIRTEGCSNQSCSWIVLGARCLYNQTTWAFWQAVPLHIRQLYSLPLAGSCRTTFNGLTVVFQDTLVKMAHLQNSFQFSFCHKRQKWRKLSARNTTEAGHRPAARTHTNTCAHACAPGDKTTRRFLQISGL